MGSEAHVLVLSALPTLLDVAQDAIAQLERRWSRFLPDSDVSILNACAGAGPLAVHPDTTLLFRTALDAWALTGGRVDPTVHDAVVAAGYNRSFEQLSGSPNATGAASSSTPQHSPGPGGITIGGDTVAMPAGVRFDPGGVGKGLAADLVAEALLDAGAEGVCVNLGGDMCVAGAAPDPRGWSIAVEQPVSRDTVAHLLLAEGAVATSSPRRRAWKGGHHLIDPATGRPSQGNVASVTVAAEACWIAEAFAKAAVLEGSVTAAAAWLGLRGTAGVVVGDDGEIVMVGTEQELVA